MPWPKGKPRPRVNKVEETKSEAAPAAEVVEQHESEQEPSSLGAEALGRLAIALTGNPAVDEAFRRSISDIVRKWEGTAVTDTSTREALYHEMQAIRTLKHQLGRVAHDGDVARKNRERLRIA